MTGYNIRFSGDWSWQDITSIIEAVEKVGNALSVVNGLMPAESFNCTFGQVNFKFRDDLPDWCDAFTDKDGIGFKPGKVQPKLAVHELGHFFTLIVDEPKPTTLLVSPGIVSGNRKITGGWVDGYLRHGGYCAPANGYVSDRYEDGYQIHPVSTPGGNSAEEDWPDIFMNWVYQSFVDNNAGRAIVRWVNEHMIGWLSIQR